MCDFCCLVDFEFCSRDIGICEPITSRDLGLLLDCTIVLGGILCGFPIIIAGCSFVLTTRCLSGWYPQTSGVSCYELIMRMTCFMFCVKFSDIYKAKEDDGEEDNGIESKNIVFKFFFYLFCCFLCPSLVLPKKEAPQPDAGEGAEEEVE